MAEERYTRDTPLSKGDSNIDNIANSILFDVLMRALVLDRIIDYLKSDKAQKKETRQSLKSLAEQITTPISLIDILKNHINSIRSQNINPSYNEKLLYLELIELATDRQLNVDEKNLYWKKGQLPNDLEMATNKTEIQEEILQNTIKDFINGEKTVPQNSLERIVHRRTEKYSSTHNLIRPKRPSRPVPIKSDEEQKAKAQSQAEAEAIYQQYLLTEAFREAKNHGRFDPQGHIIIEVHLKEADYQKIYKSITDKTSISPGKTYKETVETELGLTKHELSPSTLCNIDIKGHKELGDKFKIWVGNKPHDVSTALEKVLNGDNRHSVIALQQEAEYHMRLATRVLYKKLGSEKGSTLYEVNWEQLHETTAKTVNNDWVNAKINQALHAAYDPEKGIDYKILNIHLDQARTEMTQMCYKTLIDELGNKDTFNIDLSSLQSEIATNITKKDFSDTTATGNDYLNFSIAKTKNNTQYGHTVRISKTDITAHRKSLKADESAQRHLKRATVSITHGGETPKIEAKTTKFLRAESRAPNETPTEHFWSRTARHADAVHVYAKRMDHRDSNARKQFGDYAGPAIYNLLISHYSKMGDRLFFDGGGYQRTRLARSFHAVHLLNYWRIEKSGATNALTYIMAIPVNQHTNEISLDMKNLRGEMALMSEIAMLVTLNQHKEHLSPKQGKLVSEQFENATKLYKLFLTRKGDTVKNSGEYFRNSTEGKKLVGKLKILKTELKKEEEVLKDNREKESKPQEDESLHSLTTKALLKIQTDSTYENKQFGLVIQSLSLSLEKMAIAGCKSANERWAVMAGGSNKLVNTSERDHDTELLNPDEKDLISAFKEFVYGDGNPIKLQKVMESSLDEHGMQGPCNTVCKEDTGAPHKVQTTKTTGKQKGSVGDSALKPDNALSQNFHNASNLHAAKNQSHKSDRAGILTEITSEAAEQQSLQRTLQT